jgi:hypothetical protein
VRGEGLDELEDTLDGSAVDRDEPASDERAVPRVHDEHAVGEVVEPDGIEVEWEGMRGIAREETGVPVTRAEQGDQPQHAHEELVARDRRRPSGELVHLRAEPLARDAPERGRVDRLDRLAQCAHVVGDAAGSRRPGVCSRGDHHHNSDEGEEGTRHPHRMSCCPIVIDMSRLTY